MSEKNQNLKQMEIILTEEKIREEVSNRVQYTIKKDIDYVNHSYVLSQIWIEDPITKTETTLCHFLLNLVRKEYNKEAIDNFLSELFIKVRLHYIDEINQKYEDLLNENKKMKARIEFLERNPYKPVL